MKYAAWFLATLLSSGVLASACDVSGRNRGMMLRSWDLKEEDIRTLTNCCDRRFLTSPDRMAEAETLRHIGRKEEANA